MLRLSFLLILFIACVSGVCLAQSYGIGFDKYTVLDIVLDRRVSIPEDNSKKLIVFVFLSPECPICQNYTIQMKEIANTYDDEIELYGIFPGRSYGRTELMEFKKKYKIGFSLFVDDHFSLTNALSVKTTPTAVLINRKQQIIYTGAIDDWAISLGNIKQAPSKNYLINAINESLHNTPVSLVKTEPVGCEINQF